MKYLLDSHTAYRVVSDPQKLSAKAFNEIKDLSNELLIRDTGIQTVRSAHRSGINYCRI